MRRCTYSAYADKEMAVVVVNARMAGVEGGGVSERNVSRQKMLL